MGYKFLRELKTVGGEAVEVIKSTTKLNTKDMTVYQENIERWASEIGFEFKDKS
jgi:phosphosulfolactate synthase (CoM biosynthesis protein A)